METISLIRAHIQRIAGNTIFTTRTMLCYGARATVDSALHRLVKKEIIIRLARGVFIKWSSKADRGGIPSAREVANAKARGFGKDIFVHRKDAAHGFGLIEDGNKNPTFATFGRATSFQFRDTRIKFAHVCPKDAALGDTFPGLFIRAMRQLGNHNYLATKLAKLMNSVKKKERNDVCLAAALMPSWLSDHLCSTNIAMLQMKSLSAQSP